jgi:cytochrome c-type biogenesis protein CcmE
VNELTDDADALDPGRPPRRRRGGDDHDDDGDEGSRKRLLVVVPLVMAAAGIVGMVLVSTESKGTYSKTVDEIVAQHAGYVGRPVRVEGMLVHGSLAKAANGCEHRFTIAKNGATMPVRYPNCVVPDGLRDVPGIDVQVNVEGELHADGSLAATRIGTKCPSKYERDELIASGAKKPH